MNINLEYSFIRHIPMKNIILFAAAIMMISCASNQRMTLSCLDRNDFDTIVNNQKIALFTLHNGEMEACVTNYGGRIVSLMVPDKDGKLCDVVLGHDNIRDYIETDGNFGAIIGRYGNRINQGSFTLDSIEYQLPQNNYGHCLHGGPIGFHHSTWNATQTSDSTLVLTLHSSDGDAGFPGNLDVKVTYTLTDDYGLKINYNAETDKPTIINLTNHSYFNLSGNPTQSINYEIVSIKASEYIPIDSTFIPLGKIASVENTPFDFRYGKYIADALGDETDPQLCNGKGIDHNMVLNNDGSAVASVYDPNSGIVMDIFTDQPGLQFYIGNFLDGTVRGKQGIYYPRRSAICLETQHYPNSPNHPEWPDTRLNPGEKYATTTTYKFSVK